MLPDFEINEGFGAQFHSLRRVSPCSLDFGIGEAITAFLVTAGVGDATAGIVGPALLAATEGAGLGAAAGAATGGDPGQGALFGGLSAGALSGAGGLAGNLGVFGDAAGGIGAAGAETGATFADSLTPATLGTSSGIIDSGAFDAIGSGFGGAGGVGGIGADTGATFGDSLTPGTSGIADAGPISLPSNDWGSVPGLSGDVSPGAVSPGGGGIAAPPTGPTVAPGVEISGSPSLPSNAQALGVSTPGAPGPGGGAFTPPSGAGPGALDLTANSPGLGAPMSAADSSALGGFQGNIPEGTAQIGADISEAPSSGISAATAAPSDASVASTYGPTSTFATGDATGTPFSATEAGTGASSPSGGGGVWSTIKGGLHDVGSFMGSPEGKLLQTGVSGVGLVNSLMSASQPNPIPGQAQLQQIANQLGVSGQANTATGNKLIADNAAASTGVAQNATSQAATLQNYLNTGTLPPAVQASLDKATSSAITNIKAQYAARGMPPGSSSEIQDINAIKQNSVIQGGTLAAQLYSQGTSLDQLAASIYGQLTGTGGGLVSAGTSAQAAAAAATENQVATNTAINTGVNNAIAGLASSLGGGGSIKNGQTFVAQGTP